MRAAAASLPASLPKNPRYPPAAWLGELPAPSGHGSTCRIISVNKRSGFFPSAENGSGGGKGLRGKCWSANETCVSQAGVRRSCSSLSLSDQDKFPAWPLRLWCVGLEK